MKRLLFVAVAFSFFLFPFSNPLRAQERFDVSVMGGLNFCQIDGDDAGSYSHLGLRAGVGTSFFFGWDAALYSIIFQYVSTQTLRVMYRSYQQQTLFVVTAKAQEVCDAISAASHHGATIVDAEGAHDHGKLKMVYSVVSGADAKLVIQAVRETDPDAFVNSIRTTEIRGHFYMKPKD